MRCSLNQKSADYCGTSAAQIRTATRWPRRRYIGKISVPGQKKQLLKTRLAGRASPMVRDNTSNLLLNSSMLM